MQTKTKKTPKQPPTKAQGTTAQPRIEVRCVNCTCAKAGQSGKLLGALVGANEMLLTLLRASGVSLELPCQNAKSKRRLVPL